MRQAVPPARSLRIQLRRLAGRYPRLRPAVPPAMGRTGGGARGGGIAKDLNRKFPSERLQAKDPKRKIPSESFQAKAPNRTVPSERSQAKARKGKFRSERSQGKDLKRPTPDAKDSKRKFPFERFQAKDAMPSVPTSLVRKPSYG